MSLRKRRQNRAKAAVELYAIQRGLPDSPGTIYAGPRVVIAVITDREYVAWRDAFQELDFTGVVFTGVTSRQREAIGVVAGVRAVLIQPLDNAVHA